MPKLPEQKKSTILEVADKGVYNRGELTIPKDNRHFKVLMHHLKISVLLILICAVLGVIFVFGKQYFPKKQEAEPQSAAEVEEFKTPNEAILNYPNLEYSTGMLVDRVDLEKKVIYGKKMNVETGEFTDLAVRVLERTQITKEPPRGESSTTAEVKMLSDIQPDNLLFILATENPAENKYLNARDIVIK